MAAGGNSDHSQLVKVLSRVAGHPIPLARLIKQPYGTANLYFDSQQVLGTRVTFSHDPRPSWV